MLAIPEHPVITAYGLRANFLHLPLVFVMPVVLSKSDVRRIGFYVLLVALPMALLVFRQFTSPSDAWVNTGAGAGAGQIESAYDKIRPAGMFSFTSGLLAYISLVGSFLFYGFLKAKSYPVWLLYPALGRSVLSSMSLLVIVAMAISIFRPRLLGGSVKALLLVAALYIGVGSWTVIRQGIDVLDYRLEGGGGVKTGLVDRYFSTLFPLNAIQTSPFLGQGLGMGTNAAAGLLTGERGFLLAENEWNRVVMESGALLGLSYIGLRIAITLHGLLASITQLRAGDTLSVLLFTGFGLQMLNGQFAQPAALGFAVFGIGLSLAASKLDGEETAAAPTLSPPLLRASTVRSRSRFSESPPHG